MADMISFSETIQVQTLGRTDVVDITVQVQQCLSGGGCGDGQVVVFVPGATAAISTIEYEPGLKADLPAFFDSIAPYNHPWKHHETWGCDNGGAHIRATMMGPSCAFPVVSGRIPLGTWQQIVLIDFDTAPRSREIILSFVGTAGGSA